MLHFSLERTRKNLNICYFSLKKKKKKQTNTTTISLPGMNLSMQLKQTSKTAPSATGDLIKTGSEIRLYGL